jgi:hypothetical protein
MEAQSVLTKIWILTENSSKSGSRQRKDRYVPLNINLGLKRYIDAETPRLFNSQLS